MLWTTKRRWLLAIALGCLVGSGTRSGWNWVLGQSPKESKDNPARSTDALERKYATTVRPFLERYCFACHAAKKQEAKLDLSRDDSTAAVAGNLRLWQKVLARLRSEEMPPDDAPRLPGKTERAEVIGWLRDFCAREVARHAGDPGIVPARRLSNAEYDNTIRDLTGVDIRPAREFPVDPANEAGFDNSAESLAMSPALLKKYYAAARQVAEHVVLMPEGFVFAPHPVVADTDRDKYCVQRIVDFYSRHPVELADYFLAAWRFQHREAVGKPKASLHAIAAESRLSAKYLATIVALLTESQATDGPLGEVLTAWRKIPAAANQADVRRDCEKLRDLMLRLRKECIPPAATLQVKGISQGSQPFLLWRNDQLAANHMRCKREVEDPATAQLCRVFPDAFVVTERAPYYDRESSPKGRLLSAGFHLMHGFYRDDGPLCELVLDEKERRELDALWSELDFITASPLRQYKDFVFFERAEPPRFMYDAEFDFARPEDKDVVSEAKMKRLAQVHLAKAKKLGAGDEALKAIETYYTRLSAAIRHVERARLAAEPSHLDALVKFAERAYRRPLAPAEKDDLLAFYRTNRQKNDLGHEEALRDALVLVLMSPHFCYRLDQGSAASAETSKSPAPTADAGVRPLSDHELASRLSYFLWASMPDAELLNHAQAGDLHKPNVLKVETRRMLRDRRIRGLATEFGGNWLDFRRFEEHNSVDRSRFPSFTNELRQAMLEEPIHYFADVAQNNRSILDLLFGTDTFVNRPLARHYGMPEPAPLAPVMRGVGGEGDDWFHIPNAETHGRGGLLPMAVFLTKNAPGLRTSPVKRGYWVVRRVLGEQIPPPPPTVPELPKDEAALGDLTLPQLLARHRDNKACAGCHRRFDSVGLVFEDFGPIGERRTKDQSGHPVQTSATFPDGTDRSGLAGLRAYLHEKREDDFVDNFCRKLFVYALGRSLIPSDDKTIEEMTSFLKGHGYAFGDLVETIVASPQFLNKRHGAESAK